MGTYHQLTEYQRYQIYALKKAGHNQQCIAATLEVSPSTICRALRRNQGPRGYRPGQAHQQALARRRLIILTGLTLLSSFVYNPQTITAIVSKEYLLDADE